MSATEAVELEAVAGRSLMLRLAAGIVAVLVAGLAGGAVGVNTGTGVSAAEVRAIVRTENPYNADRNLIRAQLSANARTLAQLQVAIAQVDVRTARIQALLEAQR